jgi:O-antigen/teichoic acid export membrane protein
VRSLPPYLRLALSGWLARIAILATQLLSVRVLLHHLGTTQYATFAVINAAASWCAVLDFGLGPSVEHAVAEARARGDRVEPILRATRRLLARWLPVALLLVGLAGPVAQDLLLRPVADKLPAQSPLLLAGVGGLVVLTTLGGVGYRVFYATQRAHRHHLYTALAGLASLGGLMLLVLVDASRALAPALVVAAAPGAGFALLALGQALGGAGTTPSPDDATIARDLRTRARRHLVLALLSAAVLQVDYLVMSQTLAPPEIVTYTLLARVFGVILVFHGVLMGSSRTELTTALTRGDWRAADGIVRRSLTGSLALVAVGAFAVGVAADHVAAFFTSDPSIQFPRTLIVFFAVALALRVWSDVHTYALLALNRFDVLCWAIPAQAVVSVVGQYTLSRLYGIHGIVAGLSLSFLSVAWVTPLAYRRASRSRP